MTPQCEYFRCNAYEHWKTFANRPALRQYVLNADELEINIDDAYTQCCELSEMGEHPEWHNYEMATDDAMWQAIQALYTAGCVRLAPCDMTLHAEGDPDTNTVEFIKQLAEAEGYTEIVWEQT